MLGTRAIVGASVHGVIHAGREHEGGPAVAVLAAGGPRRRSPSCCADLQGEEASAGEQIAALLGGAPRAEDLVIVLPDPRALRPEPLLEGLRGALGDAVVVGAGAMDALSDSPLQWCGREGRERGARGSGAARRRAAADRCHPGVSPGDASCSR